MKRIKIQFFHDVICSFCFPMSYRMRKVQEIMPDVEIVHRSFALVKSDDDFTSMFASRKKAKDEILTHWEHANQNDDLHRFNIEGMRRATFPFPGSMKPLWACKAAYFVAGDAGYWDLFDALQADLFTRSKDIESDAVIFENVKHIDLDFDKWHEYFKADQVKAAVESEFELAKKYGIQVVPTLIIDDESILEGAVSLEQIIQTITTVKKAN